LVQQSFDPLSQAEEQLLHPTVSGKELTSTFPAGTPLKKIKGAKGPNPLSVKKKKVLVPNQHKVEEMDKSTIKTGLKRQREEGTDADANTKQKKRKRRHTKPRTGSEANFNQPT